MKQLKRSVPFEHLDPSGQVLPFRAEGWLSALRLAGGP